MRSACLHLFAAQQQGIDAHQRQWIPIFGWRQGEEQITRDVQNTNMLCDWINAHQHNRIGADGQGFIFTGAAVNAGDQQDEIAFVKSVVEQAVPFANFPADLVRSARSLGMLICIRPSGGGGFGFSRSPNGQRCG